MLLMSLRVIIANRPRFSGLPMMTSEPSCKRGLHRLLHRVVGHLRFAADEHRDTRGMHGEDHVRVEPVLLVIAAFFRQEQRPVGRRFGRVVDRDGPRLSCRRQSPPPP